MALSFMVIPFSLSKAIESKVCSIMFLLSMACVISRNLSAKVDLPWSMWAIMQKFLIFSCLMGYQFLMNYTVFARSRLNQRPRLRFLLYRFWRFLTFPKVCKKVQFPPLSESVLSPGMLPFRLLRLWL